MPEEEHLYAMNALSLGIPAQVVMKWTVMRLQSDEAVYRHRRRYSGKCNGKVQSDLIKS